MASSNTSVARSNPSGSQYPFPSHVNAASFVSIKLKNKTNYGRWLEQIKCLVECHGMLGFVNGELTCPDEDSEEWKRSDTLVKGWIFGSLSEDAMGTVVGLQTANDVWEKLKTSYGQQQSTSIRSLQRCMAPSLTSTTITEKDTAEYLPLCEAIMTNNWEKAKEIFNQDQGAVTAPISIDGNTALHLAINRVENIQFLENLLKEIEPDILPTLVSELYGKANPLHQAAQCDNKIAAEMLVKKNPHLLFLLDERYRLPIQITVMNSHRTTFLYLLEACENHIDLSREDGYHSPFQGTHGAFLLDYAIARGYLDVSYELIMKYPHMARTRTDRNIICPLSSIAAQWYTYYSGTRYSYFQNFVYSCLPIDINFSCDKHKIQDIENQQTRNAKLTTKCTKSCVYSGIRRIYVKFWKVAIIYVPRIKHLNGEKVKHREALLVLKCICEEVGKLTKERDMQDLYWNALRSAVYNDTVEVVEEIIKYYPAALLISINGYTITQFAITNRCEKTYSFLLNSLFYDKYVNQRILADGNNLIHLAAQLAPKHKLDLVNGAALQMQREVQWFEEVSNFLNPTYKEQKNSKGETPIMVFRREHVQLRKEGEEWMKKTADSYTITAALIITIVFAAAITVPGGNDSNSGKAIFASKSSFIIFGVSDAISLFTSTTSLLLFLSILTTRFRDEDFLYRLPKRLILGLAMLFLSVTSMMVAFSATLYLTFGQGEAWILIPIATLACLPIASFVTLQLPLLADMISSTYGRGIFAKKSGHKEKLP